MLFLLNPPFISSVFAVDWKVSPALVDSRGWILFCALSFFDCSYFSNTFSSITKSSLIGFDNLLAFRDIDFALLDYSLLDNLISDCNWDPIGCSLST